VGIEMSRAEAAKPRRRTGSSYQWKNRQLTTTFGWAAITRHMSGVASVEPSSMMTTSMF
jgi:hypothetical protein